MADFKKLRDLSLRQFLNRGTPMVWLSGFSLTVVLLMIVTLFFLVVGNGITVFWPKPLVEIRLVDGRIFLGEQVQDGQTVKGDRSIQLKIGNRDLYGLDFKWVPNSEISDITYPPAAMLVERLEWGNFYGYLLKLELENITIPANLSPERQLAAAIEVVITRKKQIKALEKSITKINDNADRAKKAAPGSSANDKKLIEMLEDLDRQNGQLAKNRAAFIDAEGREKAIHISDIVRYQQPNIMSLSEKVGYYAKRLWELFSADPRESNTEGGLFPAIAGTIMLVFLMSIISFPLGVAAGIYLKEYAKEGTLTNIVRIALNNLAGIPSIVYGIFGLGFFVYGLGASIDQLFFSDKLPDPTFGTGGILWASLTLGILTIPVVIVATEEALRTIPADIRHSSFALGATRLQTLVRILLPAATPGILTGFILAMARAAGEVAPLMITGVVKLAPSLAIDGSWPFIHLERKFMHLGFHVYDISSQSPNVEAAKPMIYVTAILLVGIVLSLSATAIVLRTRMRSKFQSTHL